MTLERVSKSPGVRLAACALGAIIIFCAAASLVCGATPQSPNLAPAAAQSSPIPLQPGKTLDRPIKGGETQSFLIRAKKGQFLHVEAEQLGIDVALTLIGPDGKQIAAMDTLNGSYGPEKLSAIAQQKGEFRLQITSGDPSAAAAHYELTLSKPRKPSPQDRTRITAESKMAHATILFSQAPADSQNRALQEFQDCAKLWHELGDSYEEGLALASAGSVFISLGQPQPALADYTAALALLRPLDEPQLVADTLVQLGEADGQLGNREKAIDDYGEALAIEKKMGDPIAQSTMLNNLGTTYYDTGEKQKALDCFSQALSLEQSVGDRAGESLSLAGLGSVYDILGDKQKALDCLNKALAIQKETGDRTGEAKTLTKIGWVLDRLGRKQDALDDYNQALVLERAVGDPAFEDDTLERHRFGLQRPRRQAEGARLLQSGVDDSSAGRRSPRADRHPRQHGLSLR